MCFWIVLGEILQCTDFDACMMDGNGNWRCLQIAQCIPTGCSKRSIKTMIICLKTFFGAEEKTFGKPIRHHVSKVIHYNLKF